MNKNDKAVLSLMGSNFSRLRNEKGLSMCRLGQLTSVSVHTISSFEKGNSNITLKTLLRLCNAISLLNLDELFRE